MDDFPFFVKPLKEIFSNFLRIRHSAHEQDLPRLLVVDQEKKRPVNVKFLRTETAAEVSAHREERAGLRSLFVNGDLRVCRRVEVHSCMDEELPEFPIFRIRRSEKKRLSPVISSTGICSVCKQEAHAFRVFRADGIPERRFSVLIHGMDVRKMAKDPLRKLKISRSCRQMKKSISGSIPSIGIRPGLNEEIQDLFGLGDGFVSVCFGFRRRWIETQLVCRIADEVHQYAEIRQRFPFIRIGSPSQSLTDRVNVEVLDPVPQTFVPVGLSLQSAEFFFR